MHNWGITPAVSQPQQLQSTAGCYQEGTGGWDSPLLAPGVQGSSRAELSQPAAGIHSEGR